MGRKNCKHLPVISLDDLREAMDVLPTDGQGEVIHQARDRAKEYLRAKKSFVWNATNITYSLRRQLISLFTDYGARVKVVYLEQPYKEILRRNRERSRKVQILFIGDDYVCDYVGAIDFGFNAILLDKKNDRSGLGDNVNKVKSIRDLSV